MQDHAQLAALPTPSSLGTPCVSSCSVSKSLVRAQRLFCLARGVYQRAVVVPTEALDRLWHDYEAFENGSGNRQLAQRVLAEFRPQYLAAHGVLQARLGLTRSLQAAALALPPGKPCDPAASVCTCPKSELLQQLAHANA